MAIAHPLFPEPRPISGVVDHELAADEVATQVLRLLGPAFAEHRRDAHQVGLAQRQISELAETLPDRMAGAVDAVVSEATSRVLAALGGVDVVQETHHLLADVKARLACLQGEMTRLAMVHEALAATVPEMAESMRRIEARVVSPPRPAR